MAAIPPTQIWLNSLRHLGAIAALSCIAVSARAEYRVFELLISETEAVPPAGEKKPATPAAPPASRVVVTTLDDQQYPGYFQLKKTERVTIQATWMCWGRQGDFQPPCPNPRAAPTTSSAAR